MNSKTPYLTRPYENSLNHHFYLYLLSDTKYTRNHQKVNLGSPIGEGDDEGEQYNTGVEHHKQAPWLGATSTNTACWSILQISDFLDLIKTPQIVFWLFFFYQYLDEKQSLKLDLPNSHLLASYDYVYSADSIIQSTRNKINTVICLENMSDVWWVTWVTLQNETTDILVSEMIIS